MSIQQAKVIEECCKSCGKQHMRLQCSSATRRKLKGRQLRRNLYVETLANTISVARTTASLIGTLPNPRIVGTRR